MTTQRPDIAPESKKLSFITKLAYGVGDLGPAMTANLLVFLLLPFFTNVAGLRPELAGLILMIGKIWDAVNDPIVGFLSDRTRSRWGRRHPWMIFGAIPFAFFFFLLWMVPDLSEWGKFWYYVAIGILFHLFYTVVNLPYAALTAELTQDYNERTILNGFRFSFSIGGSIFSLALGFIVALLIRDKAQQHLVIAGICTAIAAIALYLSVWGTRSRVAAIDRQPLPTETPQRLPFFEQLRIALTNRPYLFVIGIYLCSWLAVQITASTMKFYVVSWMGLGDAMFYLTAVTVQGTALILLSIWAKISQRVGKQTVYYMGMGLWTIAHAGLFFLQPGQVPLMFVLAVMAGFGVSTAYLVPWSLLPDVVDLDELNTGQRREGVFYSFMLLLQKIGLALGIALVGQALGWAGYIPSVAGEPVPIQPDSALLAIRLSIAPLPTLCLVCGIVLTYFYPISRQVHQEILLKLRERKQQLRGDRL